MKWDFPLNNYGQINGIADAGVETFKGTPLKSLAREVCQNSLDAGNGGIVRIQFSPFSIKLHEIIDIEPLQNAFKSALDFWQIQEDKKAKDFFKKALETINKENVQFLRISDFNTTGLTGSKGEYNTPWLNLIKSSGASDKKGVAGGSFGIGKYAPFACSKLRTVFYSTLDIDNITASQGVARLASFKQPDGQITQGIGYYGDKKNSPVFQLFNFDPAFKREETGSDIFIAGFIDTEDDWKSQIIASILDGFLGAIWNEKLTVDVDGIIIDKNTLPNLIEQYKGSISENADKYYTVISSEETKWFSLDTDDYDKIHLGLIIDTDMHRRVAMIRKTGMKVMDKSNISGVIPFAGVMFIDGENINDYLRNLENPQHTKWEPDRAEKPSQAKKKLANLTSFIKQCLEELKNEDSNEELDADGIGEYLPDDLDIETSANEEKIESISDRIIEFNKTITNKKPSVSRVKQEDKDAQTEADADENGSTGGDDEFENHGDNSEADGTRDPNSGDNGKENGQKKVMQEIRADKLRIICTNKNKGQYLIIFKPHYSAENGYLELFLSAETGAYPAVIKESTVEGAEHFEITENRIKGLTFNASDTIKMQVTIDYSDYCSMEVKAYGHKI